MSFYSRHLLPRLMNMTMEAAILDEYRRRAASAAQGTILELGFGSGVNLPFYDPERVSRLYALEPDTVMLRLAHKRMAAAPFPVEVLQMGAEKISMPDDSMDTVLSTWTLCTVPDVEAALAEVRRVLKPGGQFVFVEHGLAPEARVARWQHRLTPCWRRCAGGCHLDRKADVLLGNAGFDLTNLDTGYLGRPKTMTYMYEGRAESPTPPRAELVS